MSSWLDILPSSERQRIRERFKYSREKYASFRERVVGPEKMKVDAEYAAIMAELKLEMETEPALNDALKKQLETDINKNPERVCEGATEKQLEQMREGNFDVAVEATDEESAPDKLVMYPEGNVQERIPVKQSLAEEYASQLLS